jgi:hypothetical protein
VPLLAALARGGVDFVLIGGVAAGSYGSAYGTFDVDVAYARSRDNLERLAAILGELGATLRGAPPQLDAKTLENGANFTFATRFGALDVLAEPTGAPPYDQLKGRSTIITVSDVEVRVASLDDLIAMKEATGRTKDTLHATEYRMISDELRAPRET